MKPSFYLLLLLLLPVLAQGQIGFQVNQPKLYFNEQNGSVAPLRVTVTNPSPVRMVIRASCSDWRRDSLGGKQYFKPGTLTTSCCPYLQVEPETVELPPGAQQDMLVTLKPPLGLNQQQVHNGMLILAQINEQETADAQEKKSQFIYKVQIGVHLYHVPSGVAEKSLAIDSLTMSLVNDTTSRMGIRVNKAGHRLGVRVSNTGGLQLESHIRLELTNLQTAEETKIPAVPVNTLPGDRIWVMTPLSDKLAKGRYLIIAIVDSGSDMPLQVGELETEL